MNKIIDKGLMPPQAIKLEQAVLGAMMVDKRGIDEVLPIIKSPEVFYKQEHQHIYNAIMQLVFNNKPVEENISPFLKFFSKTLNSSELKTRNTK